MDKPETESVRKVEQQCERNAISISFVSTSGDALERLDPMFMYTQILKEILLTIKFEQQHFKEFIEYCRDIFTENEVELKNVEKLEKTYYNETPIWWYTYECFLNPMLNRALRLNDIDIIIKMGFFISDLHRYIEKLHIEQFGDYESGKTFMVYHGQSLSKTDFDQLKNTKGGLMSFNKFLSISKDRNIALHFACNTDLMGILFVMTIDPSKSTTPFAFIKEQQNEVLFSMHTVFRINDIKPIDENHHHLLQVDLILTNENDQDLGVLTNYLREETFPDEAGWLRLGLILFKMGQFAEAQQVYEVLLDQTTDENEKALVYGQLGSIKKDQGEFQEAIILYEKSLEIHKSIFPLNYFNLATLYNNIGLVYQDMNEYSNALSYTQKGLEIFQQLLPANHPELGGSYNNMGLLYEKMGEYSKALLSHEKALEIRQQSLPSNHPNLAMSYNNIGAVYDDIREYPKALLYYEKALEIKQQSLPLNHPSFGASYNNIGVLYENLGDYSKAQSFYEQAIINGQSSLPPNHPILQKRLNNLERLKKKCAYV